ncbi:hypothetical protein IF1G_03753 [Cordyceps javanica]|uniref:Biogenesis of lysosome-related organelles complex 1 subunit 1 n=1 Tax=Cordyceps javanica TaxID=43265 RepID=A0A545W4A5_9HYPO|nr:hypothetical protein IF1G_03753 [Cordyceps javanica]TQW08812.1 GCN5-like protein 1 (GCN5L1) domain-containing protein [Cordyceps javanica]
MSASSASNTSTGSSRRAAASSAASSSHSVSRATPATTMSARNTAAHLQHPQPQPQQASPRPPPPPPLLETLPSAETQRHIAEARAAVVASIGNMLDTELQGRATMLHDNAGALDKQERDVLAATEGLRREREKLAREADSAARRLKEVGNVQNWAEVLERGFLVLEETVRLAGRGGDSNGSGSWSGSGSGSDCSCSDCGRTLDGEPGVEDEMDLDGGGKEDPVAATRKGKEADVVMMDGLETMSETSRSLFDGESSTAHGTGKAKNSETASLSTTS